VLAPLGVFRLGPEPCNSNSNSNAYRPHLLVVATEQLWPPQQHLSSWLVLSGSIIVHLCTHTNNTQHRVELPLAQVWAEYLCWQRPQSCQPPVGSLHESYCACVLLNTCNLAHGIPQCWQELYRTINSSGTLLPIHCTVRFPHPCICAGRTTHYRK